MVKVYQVLMHKLLLMTNQFTLTICMSGGYDASGNSIYADAAGNDSCLGAAASQY
jgi:hypothetical protein